MDLPYTWKQSLNDVDLVIDLPSGTRAKSLTIEMKKKHLKVSLPNSTCPLIDGELHKEIKLEDSTWSVEDQKHLLVHLEKQKGQEWWSCVIQGHPEIDTTTLQPENSKLSDLDGETRAMVEKMMFDQAQKANGKPTSDELKKMEMLEKFKASHPEMDFSNVKMS